MSSFDQAKGLYDAFKSSFEAKPCDLAKCEQQLAQLKVLVLTGALSSKAAGPDAAKEQLLARDTLELACFLSIQRKDPAGFERHVAQLKMYAGDGNAGLQPSAHQHLIQGLFLLHLLAADRIGEFHTELELIQFDDQKDKYIKQPILLERCLMEGNYVKILEAQKDVPHPYYSFFMERLMETVRQKVGASLERSYDCLPSDHAAKMLIISDIPALQEFVVKENERKAAEENDDPMADMTPSLTRRVPMGLVKWEVKDGKLHFVKSVQKRLEIPALDVMTNTIGYATDLERIV
jgi:26S proteasome regulatory subunit N12